jgi:pyruvate formate lyase activating enzyme
MGGEKLLFVSGGEALFNKRTINLLACIRENGIRTALATNGTHPDALEEILDARLVNHVVMDIKTALDPDRYASVTGMKVFYGYLQKIIRSIDLLKSQRGISSEFRTTMCSLYVSREDIVQIAKYLGPEAVYTLQYYTTHQTLSDAVADKKYVIPFADLLDMAKEAEKYVLKMYVSEV